MIDLSTGRQAHTLSVDLERLGDDPTDVWSRIATYVTDALRRGTKKNGAMVVFGRVGPGMSPSNEPTTLLYLMFVDSGRRGPSQRQAIAINTALMPLGAWIEGTHVVPDDSVPLFMHVDGEAMRIAMCDEAGDWVRFALDRPEGLWTFIADVYVSADDGVPLAELGVDLPVARVGGAPERSASDTAIIEAPEVNPVVAVMDLGGVAAQFGPFAWAMLQPPPELQARLDEPIVVEWGFGAGPAFAGMQVNRCDPPCALREAIAWLFERREQMKRGHLRLVDGTRLFFERHGCSSMLPLPG